eukprot:TRINITY_DN34680_c0_g1_i1.p1 TRINITY_DN34680_c0_g1~~TRINITY_DN34680_c0_g1_i1.p1  ORF type:complete len:259 (-),score=89.88 TRINITY_DN34680_c0_g1_i1:50-826(-)
MVGGLSPAARARYGPLRALAVFELTRWVRAQPEDMMKSAVGKKPMRLAKSEPYIACDVCKLAAGEAWTMVEEAAKAAPGGKLGEIEIGAIIETVCEPDDDHGEWIAYYDVTQDDVSAPLSLTKKEYLGECRRECNTISHACSKVFDEHREDMTEMLYKNWRRTEEGARKASKDVLTADKFTSRICKKLSKTCPGKQVPTGFKHKNEEFFFVDEEGLKMRKMQYTMNKAAKEQGASQPVQFLDPMGMGSMFPGMDDDDL